MDYLKTQSVSINKTIKKTNCYLWATKQRHRKGGRVFFRWTVNSRFSFLRWLHALHLEYQYDHLVETRFRWHKYWSIGCSHWKGIPFPRIYWLSEEHAGYLRQAVPEEGLGKVWIPPLMFNAIIKEGDNSCRFAPASKSPQITGIKAPGESAGPVFDSRSQRIT